MKQVEKQNKVREIINTTVQAETEPDRENKLTRSSKFDEKGLIKFLEKRERSRSQGRRKCVGSDRDG